MSTLLTIQNSLLNQAKRRNHNFRGLVFLPSMIIIYFYAAAGRTTAFSVFSSVLVFFRLVFLLQYHAMWNYKTSSNVLTTFLGKICQKEYFTNYSKCKPIWKSLCCCAGHSRGSYYKITNTKFFRPSIKVSRNSAAITPLSTKSIAAVTAPIRNLDKALAAKCIRIKSFTALATATTNEELYWPSFDIYSIDPTTILL